MKLTTIGDMMEQQEETTEQAAPHTKPPTCEVCGGFITWTPLGQDSNHLCVTCDPSPSRSLVGAVWSIAKLSTGQYIRHVIWDQQLRPGHLDLYRDVRDPGRMVTRAWMEEKKQRSYLIPTPEAWERNLIDLEIQEVGAREDV